MFFTVSDLGSTENKIGSFKSMDQLDHVTIHPEKSFIESNKFVHCYAAKEKFLWFIEISCFNLKKKFSSFKVIKLNKLFLNFLPVLYLNQINIFLNQINNVEKMISSI